MNRRNSKIHARTRRTKATPTAENLTLQTIALREARKFALLVLCCGLPAYIYIQSIPEKKALTELEQQLVTSQHNHKLSVQNNDRITRELQALNSNQDYLEIVARDYLNLAERGETVIRIDR